jgi:hypothetical protein
VKGPTLVGVSASTTWGVVAIGPALITHIKDEVHPFHHNCKENGRSNNEVLLHHIDEVIGELGDLGGPIVEAPLEIDKMHPEAGHKVLQGALSIAMTGVIQMSTHVETKNHETTYRLEAVNFLNRCLQKK